MQIIQHSVYRTRLYLLIAISGLPFFSYAQQENWNVYMAQFENKPGSVMVDMGLKPAAPMLGVPYIVITGVTFNECNPDGLPYSTAFDRLYKVSDSVKALMDKRYTNKLAGTFTHKCQRLDYFYIKDTNGVRQRLLTLYAERFPAYTPYISIKPDPSWKIYLEFLYPNEETMEYMQNEKTIMALKRAGDKLQRPRQVDHFAYFKTEDDRTCFISFTAKNGYKTEAKEKSTDPTMPFKLRFSRVDKITVAGISKITLELRKEAAKCNGSYDGWETFVIK